MSFITLKVTAGVIQEVNRGHEYEKQIAIQPNSNSTSSDLRDRILTATAQNKIIVAICGVFSLAVGDTGAIWKKHQSGDNQVGDFSDLYSLLARRPDVEVKFPAKLL